MNLKTLLSGLDNLKAKGDLDIDITSVEYDSRKVKEGSLFVAIKGFNVDGHEYIKSAVDNGAKAILIEEGAKIKKRRQAVPPLNSPCLMFSDTTSQP